MGAFSVRYIGGVRVSTATTDSISECNTPTLCYITCDSLCLAREFVWPPHLLHSGYIFVSTCFPLKLDS